MDREHIRRLVTSFREAIVKAQNAGELDGFIMFPQFPKGCCRDASQLLAEYLLTNGIETNFVSGEYNPHLEIVDSQAQSHAWLTLSDGTIIDITGSQFIKDKDYFRFGEDIYFGTVNAFHNLFRVKDKYVFPGLINYSEMPTYMFELYDIILNHLKICC